MNPLLNEALACLNRGWSILPVHAGTPRDKDPHAAMLIRTGHHRPDPDHPGRVRAAWKPLQETPPTEQHVRTWFTDPTDKGLALITGRISGRIVIDFDGDDGRDAAHALGIRPHVITGSGGYHWHLAAPDFRVQNVVGKSTTGAPDCIDVRGDGGNAILPPTRTRKGEYRYLRHPNDLDTLRDVPPDLREALRLVPPVPLAMPAPTGPLPTPQNRYPSAKILTWAIQKVHTGDKGGRNDVGYLLAWALLNNGYTTEEALAVGHAYVDAVGTLTRPPYTLDEYRTSLRSAAQVPRGAPWGTPNSRDRSDTAAPARSSAEALEDAFPHLQPDDRVRGAYLLARDWAAKGRPIQDTVTFLRLIGHADAARTARMAYQDAEAGRPAHGTLAAFLTARRVRVPERATHRRLT